MRRPDETGASAVEYGLVLAAIAAVVVTAVFALGPVTNTLFTSASQCIEAQLDSSC